MCDNHNMMRLSPVFLGILIIFTALVLDFSPAHSKGIWSKVAASGQNDFWYIDQTLTYEKHSKITTSRAYLKFVPGKDSELSEEIRESLDLSGVISARFAYLIAAVAIDCRTRLFHFSEIIFFDEDDKMLLREDYGETQYYAAITDHPSENISHYLCLDKSGFFDTLKKQEPFLYLFPK